MTSASASSVIATGARDSSDADVSVWRCRGWVLSSHFLRTCAPPARDSLCPGRKTSAVSWEAELSPWP